MAKKMSMSWYLALTSPFPDLRHIERPLHIFEPQGMGKHYLIGTDRALRLSQCLTAWMERIDHLPVDEVMKERLRACTSRFSCWDEAIKKDDMDNKVKWYRTKRRCNRAKLCPWCRQRIVLDMYSKLAPLAQNRNLSVSVKERGMEDRVKFPKGPRGLIASIRNVTFLYSPFEPEFTSVFFVSKWKHPKLVPCTKDDLTDYLTQVLSWNLFSTPDEVVTRYMDLMGNTRLWSLNMKNNT
jgi:hypothetical protein